MKVNLFQNAKQEPQILYCRHIAQGVCGYNDETIFIGEDTLKKMDSTFAGKPLYVEHQQVDLEKLQEQADGYVVESFYLPEDASHWAKIIVVSDKGHEAVSKGWAVSNAYVPDAFGANGEWHNIPYQREITEGHYTHLAIVSNPRYEEDVIMTPEEFKQYKAAKKEQLNQLQNSKKEEGVKQTMSMFKLFKKEEMKNSEDISKAVVELSNGKTVSIQEMINACEEDIKAKEAAKAKKNAEEELLEKVVKVNGEDVKVSELIKAYESAKKNAEEDEKKDEDEEDKDEKKSKKNEDKDEEKKSKKNKCNEEDADKENEDEDEKEDEDDKEEKKSKKNSKDFLKALKEAEEIDNSKENNVVVADTMDVKLARGFERYGSSK